MELIVSLTSYPLRIMHVNEVLISLLEQKTSIPFKIVFVLAEIEFPNKFDSLPHDLQETLLKNTDKIELLWYDKNIRSHKKLIPTLKKYPNADILIVDDDIIRPQGFIQNFIDDHLKYPTDIIGGCFMYHLNNDMKFNRYDGEKGVNCGTYNNISNIPLRFSRPANGCGGLLYPAHTFQNELFFNEELMTEVCPYSDESWQYMFNILEGRNIRQLSKIYDHSDGVLPNSQQCGLYRKNRYDQIFSRLFMLFPEFLLKIRERQYNEIIVSMASYGERLKNKITDMAIQSLLKQTLKPYKIVLNIPKDDYCFLSDYLLNLISNQDIEVFLVENDLGPHNKYFWVMQNYPNNPIITTDDDIIYTTDMVESLAKSYVEFPTCVSARRVHKINIINGQIAPYKQWGYEYNKEPNKPSDLLFPTGGGGALYPPSILNINNDMIEDIKECLTVDDFYLKKLQLDRGVKTVYVENLFPMGTPITNEVTISTALYKINCTQNKNNNYLHYLNRLLTKINNKSLKIGICAIIKNEHLYLDEWLQHHLNIGFTDIYLYEDYESESHKDITDKYSNVYLNTVESVGLVKDNQQRQKSLYQWFCKTHKDEMDWCAFIDIDEFIMLQDISLNDLCNKFSDSKYDAFALYWRMFNANGHVMRPQGAVVKNFTKQVDVRLTESFSLYTYKSIVNMHRDIKYWTNVHKPNNTCNTEGERIDFNPKLNKITYKYGAVNHYFTKSLEEFQNRLQRGNISKNLRKLNQFKRINKEINV